MGSERKTSEDLVKMEVWSESALAYGREHGRPKLVWLLKAVMVEIELEKLLSGPSSQEHPGPGWRVPLAEARREEALAAAAADEAVRARRAEEREKAKVAVWETFLREERRELEMRKAGQLGRLLGEALPGEPSGALVRLAEEDCRQAREGLVALMGNGKVSYKSVEDLCEGDMPARVAASRARTAWLKERRDAWLGRGEDVQGSV